MQNLGQNLPPFPQDSFSRGESPSPAAALFRLTLSLSAITLLSTARFIRLLRWDLAKQIPSIKQIVNVQSM